MMQQHEYEVTDLTDVSGIPSMQQSVYFLYNTNDSQFPTYFYTQWVDPGPRDINGMKIFKIICFPRDWVQKTHDLRSLKMHSSKWKDLLRTRKVGRYIGNLYCPYNECPTKVSADGKRNTSNSKNVEDHKMCFSFEHFANRQWCGAQNMTEYYRVSVIFMVYHLAMHMYIPKPNTRYKRQVREAVGRNSGVIACAI